MDIFWGSSQNRTILCILGSFLKVKVKNGVLGLVKFQIFFGVLEIPVILLLFFFFLGGGGTVDAGPEPTYGEKYERTPPPTPGTQSMDVDEDSNQIKTSSSARYVSMRV